MRAQELSSSVLAPWITVRFDRAAGPGGQNVNKINTRALLLLDLAACPLFSESEKIRLRERLARRLTRAGQLRVVAQQHRTQAANRAAAEQRLTELLVGALRVEPPRRPTRPTAGSRVRRRAAKERRSAVKRLRTKAAGGD